MGQGLVAQVSNLPYRRLPVGRTSLPIRTASGLETRDTAGWKPALRLAVFASLGNIRARVEEPENSVSRPRRAHPPKKIDKAPGWATVLLIMGDPRYRKLAQL